tara:strand:+ start:359 stop:538 length:180 start_codon:yes stop_codon:yes gene_type:complete
LNAGWLGYAISKEVEKYTLNFFTRVRRSRRSDDPKGRPERLVSVCGNPFRYFNSSLELL